MRSICSLQMICNHVPSLWASAQEKISPRLNQVDDPCQIAYTVKSTQISTCWVDLGLGQKSISVTWPVRCVSQDALETPSSASDCVSLWAAGAPGSERRTPTAETHLSHYRWALGLAQSQITLLEIWLDLTGVSNRVIHSDRLGGSFTILLRSNYLRSPQVCRV